MKLERTASHSMPATTTRFAPISECEGSIFAALRVKESSAAAVALATGRKARLPRFSLLRGEVALMAERVFPFTR